jgi:hypothetical protein
MQCSQDEFEKAVLENKSVRTIVDTIELNGLKRHSLELHNLRKSNLVISFVMELSADSKWLSGRYDGRQTNSKAKNVENETVARKMLEVTKQETFKKLSSELYFEKQVKADKSYSFASATSNTSLPIGDVKYQWETICRTCNGTKRVDCSEIGSRTAYNSSLIGIHQQKCFLCDGRGKNRCHSCLHGEIHENVYFTDHNGSEKYVYRTRRCNYCDGTAYSGRCSNCIGLGYVSCTTCAGTGHVRCHDCSGFGIHTNFVGYKFFYKVSKKIVTPRGIDEQIATIIKSKKPIYMFGLSDICEPEFEMDNGTCRVTYRAMIQHLSFLVKINNEIFNFNAFGKNQMLSNTPPFLDNVLDKFFNQTQRMSKGKKFDSVIKLSTTFELPVRVLKLVLANNFDVNEFVKQYRGFVSEEFVAKIAALLETSCRGLGRIIVKTVWQRAFWFISIISFVPTFFAFDLYLKGFFGSLIVIEQLKNIRVLVFLAIFLVPGIFFISLTTMIASRLGKRSVARITGSGHVKIEVKQGIYPLLGLTFCLVFVVLGFGGRLLLDQRIPGSIVPMPYEEHLIVSLGLNYDSVFKTKNHLIFSY